jgi:hypothetical protein
MLTTASFRVESPPEEARFPLVPRTSAGRCACGGVVDRSGECGTCRARRFMREALQGRGAAPSPAHGHVRRLPETDFGAVDVFGRRPCRPGAITIASDTRVERHAVARAAMLSDSALPDARQADELGPAAKLAQAAPAPAPPAAPAPAPPGAPAPAAPAAPAARAAPACTYAITYANLRVLGCGALCGAQIRYDITRVTARGAGCPATLAGLRLTEAVATDQGCTPGGVAIGAGCAIGAGGALAGCRDTYALCAAARGFPAAGCTERYTQQLFVGGQLAETRTITFRIRRRPGSCTGRAVRT